MVCIFLCPAGWCHKTRTINVQEYIADHQFLAHVLSGFYGIPYPVIMGVAIIESSAGTCDIAVVLNNHFGIVGRNHFRNKRGHKSAYKQYYNDWLSYIDFCIYVSKKKFYHHLKHKPNPDLWTAAMRDMGYSTEPDEWCSRVRSAIRRYHLYQPVQQLKIKKPVRKKKPREDDDA